MRSEIQAAFASAGLLACLASHPSLAACDVFGPAIADPAGDAPTRTPLITGLQSLDIERVQNCYDSAADRFEFRITAHDASTLPAWGEWAAAVYDSQYTTIYAIARTGVGGKLTGVQLMRHSYPHAVPETFTCLSPINAYVTGNTIVMVAPRQDVDLATFVDDVTTVLAYPGARTGLDPAPRLTEGGSCGLPSLETDQAGRVSF